METIFTIFAIFISCECKVTVAKATTAIDKLGGLFLSLHCSGTFASKFELFFPKRFFSRPRQGWVHELCLGSDNLSNFSRGVGSRLSSTGGLGNVDRVGGNTNNYRDNYRNTYKKTYTKYI